jgi:hypothetical protein
MPPKISIIAATAACLLACAAHATQGDLQISQGAAGQALITLPNSPSSYVAQGETPMLTDGAVVGRLSRQGLPVADAPAPAFRWQGDTLLHPASGVALPKMHAGCALTALEPIMPPGDVVASYAHGAVAEYDCPAGADLSYVMVVFETDTPALKGKPLQTGLAQLASTITIRDSHTAKTACTMMDISGTTVPNRQLTAAQCGAKWRKGDTGDIFGSATVIVGRGTTFASMTNTCAEPHCAANRKAFGNFVDTIDFSAIGPQP